MIVSLAQPDPLIKALVILKWGRTLGMCMKVYSANVHGLVQV